MNNLIFKIMKTITKILSNEYVIFILAVIAIVGFTLLVFPVGTGY